MKPNSIKKDVLVSEFILNCELISNELKLRESELTKLMSEIIPSIRHKRRSLSNEFVRMFTNFRAGDKFSKGMRVFIIDKVRIKIHNLNHDKSIVFIMADYRDEKRSESLSVCLFSSNEQYRKADNITKVKIE